jgi:hypothetical protein
MNKWLKLLLGSGAALVVILIISLTAFPGFKAWFGSEASWSLNADSEFESGQKKYDWYQNYLKKYPDSRHHAEALSRFDDLNWHKIPKLNSQRYTRDQIRHYHIYLKEFKNGKHAVEAKKLIGQIREAIDWNEAWRNATVLSVQSYLNLYPDGKHAKNAKELIKELRENEGVYLRALARGSRKDIEKFMQEFPGHIKIEAAKQVLLNMRERGLFEVMAAGQLKLEVIAQRADKIILNLQNLAKHRLNVIVKEGTLFAPLMGNTCKMITYKRTTIRMNNISQEENR